PPSTARTMYGPRMWSRISCAVIFLVSPLSSGVERAQHRDLGLGRQARARARFDLVQALLRDAGKLGELLLREPARDPQAVHVTALQAGTNARLLQCSTSCGTAPR